MKLPFFSRLIICLRILLRATGGLSEDLNTTTNSLTDTTKASTDEPFVYQEGYVFDEPAGHECVKWGNYIEEGQRETVDEFRNRWTVQNGKKIQEECDSSRRPGECDHPLECINNKCQCAHVWSIQEKRCEISPQWVPTKSSPGCIVHEDCVESAECFLQYPCHCVGGAGTGKCEVAYGICICAHPYPPLGFRDGNCERSGEHLHD